MPTIGNKGEKLDLLIRQGGTFGPHIVTWTNPDGTPVDLSDMFFRAQIRKNFNSEVVSATFTTYIVDALQGKFAFEIDAIQTANLLAGLDEGDPQSAYVWDIESVNEVGYVTPLLYGDVAVFREITK